jgi:hypothetical protein
MNSFGISQNTTLGITNLFLDNRSGQEWDIVIEDGQLLTVTGIEYIVQKVTQFLRFVKNEVITGGEYGIPYFEDILGVKNPNLSSIQQTLIESILDNETLSNLGVTDVSIDSVELVNRRLIVSGLKITANNETLQVAEGISL